ncbi:DUF748 domain-containing protein [Cupriavidus respiraculi]|uniref:DUF748 domain-containing protein n=1 Tax=Cupriavidus respiraculi TaxID=195930 RepID=UPI001C97D3EB|nr:DUF748 domain-containing protein [Cupriavidus respiraculi]MBY4948419.1 DUF748 domain-containing protein [Cupriavidus respiraculi]
MASKFSFGAATATPRRRLALRVAGGVVAAVALFAVAGYAGAPALIKSFGASKASEALGRKVTIGDARVRPFSLAATVSDVTIYQPDGTTPMVTLRSADVDAASASLWRFAPVVDTVHLDGLTVNLARDAAGRMSYADIQERLAARPAEPSPKEPARFSINNIALTGGTVVFDDRLLGQTQRIEHLTITLPFLSNLPHDVNIVTQPTVSAQVNGSPLALSGTMLPFADAREANLNLHVDGLDVARYMVFAPPLADARVQGGKLDTRLAVGFRQDKDRQDIFLSGTLALRDADVRKRDGSPLLKAGTLAVDIGRLEPLARKAHVKAVALDGLDVQALRRADGSLDLATAFVPTPAAKPAPAAAAPAPLASAAPASAPAPASAAAAASAPHAASAPAPSGTAPAPATDPAPWTYAVDRISVNQARLALRDEAAPSGPGTLALGPLDVRVDNLSGNSDKPAALDATLAVAKGQTVRHKGALSLRDRSLAGTVRLDGVRPQGFAAWWPTALQLQLGESAVQAELNYRMSWAEPVFQFALDKSRIEVSPLQATLRNAVGVPTAADTGTRNGAADAQQQARRERRERIARERGDLVGDKLPLMRADKVAVEGLTFDLARQSVQLDEVRLARPQFAVTRDHRGELLETARIWAVESRAAQSRAATAPPRSRANATASAAASGARPAQPAPWNVLVGKVAVEGGAVRLSDYAPAAANRNRPVVHQLRKVALTTGAIRWPMTPAAIPLSFKAESGRRGALAIDGTVAPATPAMQLQLDLNDLDIAPLQPYLADRFNAALRGGTASAKGKLALVAAPGKPLAVSYAGNARLANVRTVDRISGEDFLRWRSVAVAGIDFRMDEAKGPLKLGLDNIVLSDFYARVILNANGRLNLQDVMSGGADKGERAPTRSLTQASPGAASAPVAETPAGPKPEIRIGGVKVEKGNINFSDFFVRPNYTANLTGMKGSVSKVATGDPAPADLVLEGRLDDDAPVTISGKLNPLGEQLYLDIAAKAAGVELTRLTPYAAKYAGYPITKGKMTVDVGYKIENGRLDARNHLFLDQLTFGDRVDSPDATKLPVLLAVSLLKDRNGVIDVNLPVSGSLSDPEFSIGGVIARVIVNLLTKAITSPFSLIASAFGGGDELGYVEFAPGTATLGKQEREKLATLARAMNDRPALRLEITGRIDPATDAEGARKAWLDAQVLEQKVRDQRQRARGQGAAEEADGEGGEQGAKVTVTAQEYPKYLAQVYDRADFKKPRNVIGLTRSLPTAEMEKLLLENAPVTDAGLRELAERRALLVKQTLEREGKVPEARLFLTAPKLTPEGIKDKGMPNRVDFMVRQ